MKRKLAVAAAHFCFDWPFRGAAALADFAKLFTGSVQTKEVCEGRGRGPNF